MASDKQPLNLCCKGSERLRTGSAVSPEDAAELRVEEDVTEEGMLDDAVETKTEAGTAAGTPMEAAPSPMAKPLTGPRPEGAETVAGPTEEP